MSFLDYYNTKEPLGSTTSEEEIGLCVESKDADETA